MLVKCFPKVQILIDIIRWLFFFGDYCRICFISIFPTPSMGTVVSPRACWACVITFNTCTEYFQYRLWATHCSKLITLFMMDLFVQHLPPPSNTLVSVCIFWYTFVTSVWCSCNHFSIETTCKTWFTSLIFGAKDIEVQLSRSYHSYPAS